nr:MAG TPA: hypothetical protein [Caudoviricetes sp.]
MIVLNILSSLSLLILSSIPIILNFKNFDYIYAVTSRGKILHYKY